jgi:homeobox-leucine zipper protein
VENNRYKEALRNASCPNCGGPAALGEMSFDEQHLRIENVRLREEVTKTTPSVTLINSNFVILQLVFNKTPVWLQIDRISGIAAKYVGKPLSSLSNLSPHLPSRSLDLGVSNFGAQSGFVGEMFGATDLLRSVTGPTEADKSMIVEIAVAAMEELMRIAQAGEPLWIQGENNTEMLNEEEYLRTFTRGIGPKPLGMRSEASRESAVVIMNHVNLVEILMDAVGFSTF